MTDQSNDGNIQPTALDSGILASVPDIITDLVTGSTIPAPIRKNAIKAFGQLCTALIDVPVAHLEGIAAEKRAEAQARVKIISTSADQIASQLKVDPEYARVAVKKFGQKIVREQINLDKVTEVAARTLQQESAASATSQPNTQEVPEISSDWLNQFEKEASQKSSEEMQLLFGRILAGEIQKPSSYSIKTVRLLGDLDTVTANLFVRLCSLAISLRAASHVVDARVVSLGGNAASNALKQYGLPFDHLNILHEHGLIIPDYNSYVDYQVTRVNEKREVSVPFTHQNKLWALVPTGDGQRTGEVRLHGVGFSRSGKELLSIVDAQPSNDYTTALKHYFSTINFSMTEVTKQP